MQIEQVDFVSIPTRDVGRAVAWYRDVLGLRESEFSPAEVEAPNVTLGFWDAEADGERFTPIESGIAFRVADVDAAVEEARAGGAEIVGVEDTGICHRGFVKNPDGNALILHRRYAPRRQRVES
jgi:catechol 2,3-dioxygenase-like lactoylglutathione lyase family enzyme